MKMHLIRRLWMEFGRTLHGNIGEMYSSGCLVRVRCETHLFNECFIRTNNTFIRLYDDLYVCVWCVLCVLSVVCMCFVFIRCAPMCFGTHKNGHFASCVLRALRMFIYVDVFVHLFANRLRLISFSFLCAACHTSFSVALYVTILNTNSFGR